MGTIASHFSLKMVLRIQKETEAHVVSYCIVYKITVTKLSNVPFLH